VVRRARVVVAGKSGVSVLTVGTQEGIEGGELSNKVGLQDGARKKDTFSRNLVKARDAYEIYQSIPAVAWVILLPLQLRTHHIGQAPGLARVCPYLPNLLDQKRPEAKRRDRRVWWSCVIEATAAADAVQECHREF
jgi:hypothetical protein